MNCKNCTFWTRFGSTYESSDYNIGKCSELENDLQYWEFTDAAQEKIKDGKIGCENLFTHENFGCIHFKEIEKTNSCATQKTQT